MKKEKFRTGSIIRDKDMKYFMLKNTELTTFYSPDWYKVKSFFKISSAILDFCEEYPQKSNRDQASVK